MIARLNRIFRLGIKELYSLRADPVMVVLIIYTFTIAVYTVSTGAKLEVENASVAVVDEDGSMLSARLRDGLLAPFFKPPVLIAPGAVDEAMDTGRFVFVLEIPPRFEEDLLAGRKASLGLEIDATAMSQAGNGASYIRSIVMNELQSALPRSAGALPVDLVVTARFNPNLQSTWFTSVMQVINNITMLSVILTGAALIREREHGTIEHLLVMPVLPLDIMLAKIWANGAVIVLAASLSLALVVKLLLAVPIAGSLALFIFCTAIYQFSVTSLGILIATASRSMAQFGLISIPILMAMNLLSGSTTPMDSMPAWLREVLIVSPTPHFVAISQAILYRGAGWQAVWQDAGILFLIGGCFFAAALFRFRRSLADQA